MSEKIWIALAIGNSRYHWAWFLNTQLQSSWDSAYFDIVSRSTLASSANRIFLELLPPQLQQLIIDRQIEINQIPIYLASVVPSQTVIWQQIAQVEQITLADIPLHNLYPTLGIDRALAILGAGEKYGYPVLVIDGGTALTITGIDEHHSLFGGAILPGLRLQFRSLFTGTSALPEIELPLELPPRWSNNTSEAISSGILHTISSGIRDFIRDWLGLFPQSQIICTGGDGEIIGSYLRSSLSDQFSDPIIVDLELLFRGIAVIVDRQST